MTTIKDSFPWRIFLSELVGTALLVLVGLAAFAALQSAGRRTEKRLTRQALEAQQLAEASGAALCGIVGHTVVLYRPDPEKPRIELPARGD